MKELLQTLSKRRCCFAMIIFPFLQDEQIFYDSFSSEEFVNKFVGFLSLEDRKGKDKFDGHRSSLFKVLKLRILLM